MAGPRRRTSRGPGEGRCLIRNWTGHQPRDVGPFGLRLNLESSDLDLSIGYPVDQRDTLITVLGPHTVFKGERKPGSPLRD